MNKGTGLKEILSAVDHYFAATGRRVSYEYVLLSGVNDQPQHAEELARLLRGRNAHVNLIPMNGVSELVLAGKKAGVEAPKEAYQVPGQGVPKNASLAGSKFLIGGNSYNSWDQVPNSYKTHNSKANNINPAPVNLLKFKF